jgi:hypothetical protein
MLKEKRKKDCKEKARKGIRNTRPPFRCKLTIPPFRSKLTIPLTVHFGGGGRGREREREKSQSFKLDLPITKPALGY